MRVVRDGKIRDHGPGSEFFFFKQKTAYEIYQCDWSRRVLFRSATYPLLYMDFNYIVDNFQKMADKTETNAMFGALGNQARPRTFLEIRWDNLCNFARFSWEMEAGIGG